MSDHARPVDIAGHFCGQTQPHAAHVWYVFDSTAISVSRLCAGVSADQELAAPGVRKATAGGDYTLTNAEWFAFQRIPDQGYSHRAWVEARIRERMAQAWDEGREVDNALDFDAVNPYRDVALPPEGGVVR